MGDHGDDMFDDDLRNDSCFVCEHHGILYSPRWGCSMCEDGEPAKPKKKRPARGAAGERTE